MTTRIRRKLCLVEMEFDIAWKGRELKRSAWEGSNEEDFCFATLCYRRSLISTSAPPSVCLLSVSDVSSFLEDRFPLELVWSSFKRGKCLLRRDSRCQLAFNPQGFVGRNDDEETIIRVFSLEILQA